MKIEVTPADIQKLAGNTLRKKKNAEKALREDRALLKEVLQDAVTATLIEWVLEREEDDPQVDDDDDEEDDDDCDD